MCKFSKFWEIKIEISNFFLSLNWFRSLDKFEIELIGSNLNTRVGFGFKEHPMKSKSKREFSERSDIKPKVETRFLNSNNCFWVVKFSNFWGKEKKFVQQKMVINFLNSYSE